MERVPRVFNDAVTTGGAGGDVIEGEGVVWVKDILVAELDMGRRVPGFMIRFLWMLFSMLVVRSNRKWIFGKSCSFGSFNHMIMLS